MLKLPLASKLGGPGRGGEGVQSGVDSQRAEAGAGVGKS